MFYISFSFKCLTFRSEIELITMAKTAVKAAENSQEEKLIPWKKIYV
ncbi:MAG: hypothetical protein IKG00_01240 [Lachnospiraceae bacterium]|nr:hypothetical protein [Lachnospiraceae bacterium]